MVRHKSSPCFYVFDPRATESLLDATFSLNPLRISQNRTMTEGSPFLRFLTFIDRPLDSARSLGPKVHRIYRLVSTALMFAASYRLTLSDFTLAPQIMRGVDKASRCINV